MKKNWQKIKQFAVFIVICQASERESTHEGNSMNINVVNCNPVVSAKVWVDQGWNLKTTPDTYELCVKLQVKRIL